MDMLMFSTMGLQHWWVGNSAWCHLPGLCQAFVTVPQDSFVSGVTSMRKWLDGLTQRWGQQLTVQVQGRDRQHFSGIRAGAGWHLYWQHWIVHSQGKVPEGKVGRAWNKIIFKVPSYPTVLWTSSRGISLLFTQFFERYFGFCLLINELCQTSGSADLCVRVQQESVHHEDNLFTSASWVLSSTTSEASRKRGCLQLLQHFIMTRYLS